jgi:phage FluMu gp28-like protein
VELIEKVTAHLQAMRIACKVNNSLALADAKFRSFEVTIPGVTRITAIPANPRTARGFTGDVFLDEFAMHEQDRDIWAAVMPSTTFGTSEIDVASTPKGCSNVFAELCKNPLFTLNKVTILDAIEQGHPANVDTLRALCGDDAIFRQEYMCEFLDGTFAFLHSGHVFGAVISNYTENTFAGIAELAKGRYLQFDPSIAPGRATNFYAGVDIGRYHDLTVLWIIARLGRMSYTVTVRRLKGAPFSEQVELLCSAMDTIPSIRCMSIDATGLGLHLAEQMEERYGHYRINPVVFTESSKNELAGRVRMELERGTFRIPPDQDIRDDFLAMRKEVTRAGGIRVLSAQVGGRHADLFWAAALALDAAKSQLSGRIPVGIAQH